MEMANSRAPVTALHLDSFNPQVMEETVRGAAFEHVQLARGRFRARLLSVQRADKRLDYGRYNLPLHARGPMPSTHLTLGFILKSNGAARLNGYEIERPALVLLGEGSELDFRMAPGSEWLAFQVQRESLERLGTALPDRPDKVFHIAPEDEWHTERNLRAAIAGLHEVSVTSTTIADPDGYCHKIFASILDSFCAALQETDFQLDIRPRDRARENRLARRAIDFIDAHFGETLHIGLMCAELETNSKALERAFLNYTGLAPKRYLDFVRLSKARRLLTQTRETQRSISDTAISCGINHLGRFAALYKATFDELPSQTADTEATRRCDESR
jgi:AraC-like DNA-binding protein